MRDKIVVIGSLNYDIILKIPRLPECGETLPANQVTFSAGGKGANQAVQAAKLGIHTYLVGCVGEDAHGAYLLDSAKNYGVNTDYIKKTKEATGMGIVNAVQDGSVFACIVRGANFAITNQEIDDAEKLMKEAELVILQMEIPQSINEYAIKKAKQCGCKVLLNAAPAEKMSEQYLKQCDIIVVNEVEAGFYLEKEIKDVEQAKEGAEKLAQKYNADIIITLGKAGAVVSEKEKIKFIPSKKVDAVETTGAGDSFIGGVGYALMQGKNLTEACEFATCCSAVTVRRPGAQPSMPTLDEVLFEK